MDNSHGHRIPCAEKNVECQEVRSGVPPAPPQKYSLSAWGGGRQQYPDAILTSGAKLLALNSSKIEHLPKSRFARLIDSSGC